jgi:mRNA interferase MazF
MSFERGEIVLLAFPFTSESGVKQRPALILLDTGDQDVLVARVTTQASRSQYDMVIRDWRTAGLLAPSVVRLDKLATLERTLVRRPLGRLSDVDWSAVQVVLRHAFCQP